MKLYKKINWLFRAILNKHLPGNTTTGHFRYIKIQLDSEAWRKQTKEMNKQGNSIAFVCVLQASLPC